jgi:hypothetical protein
VEEQVFAWRVDPVILSQEAKYIEEEALSDILRLVCNTG